MPKMPKFEDWTPSWEAKGEDFDAERAKKFIYDLLSDKERLQEKVATITGERDAAQAKATEAERKDMTELDRLKAENEELKGTPKTDALTLARYELALEHGLTKTQAKRLVGSTREELEADVQELKADLGGSKRETTPPPETDERKDAKGSYSTGNKGKDEPVTDPSKLVELFR